MPNRLCSWSYKSHRREIGSKDCRSWCLPVTAVTHVAHLWKGYQWSCSSTSLVPVLKLSNQFSMRRYLEMPYAYHHLKCRGLMHFLPCFIPYSSVGFSSHANGGLAGFHVWVICHAAGPPFVALSAFLARQKPASKRSKETSWHPGRRPHTQQRRQSKGFAVKLGETSRGAAWAQRADWKNPG